MEQNIMSGVSHTTCAPVTAETVCWSTTSSVPTGRSSTSNTSSATGGSMWTAVRCGNKKSRYQCCAILWLSHFSPRFSGDFSGFPSQRITVSILIWLTRLIAPWMLWLIMLTRSTISKWFHKSFNVLFQASEYYSINFEIDAAMKAEKIDLQGSSSDSLGGGTPTYSSGANFNSETDKFRTGPVDYSL